MNSGKFSFRSRKESFRYAINGIVSILKSEHNARIHLGAAILAIIAGIILKIELSEWCLIAIVICLVFITELINTSVEKLSDAVDKTENQYIKKAKDYAAASVLIASILSVIVGGIIFIPRIIRLF